jgi:hypothetical protein
MKISKITQGLVLLAVSSSALALGCELIVDFDRTRIPIEAGDATFPDGSPPSTQDAAPATDAAADATDASDADITDAAADG